MEEAKLIFELVNRSGVQGGGGPAAPGGQQGQQAPTATDQFRESTAGGVGGSLSGNNPQQPGKPAASVPPSPAASVSQPITSPPSQPSGIAEPAASRPSQPQVEQSTSAIDAARQLKEIVNAIKPATNQIPVVGSLVSKAGGFADIAAKIGPLFAPKAAQVMPTRSDVQRDMRQAEADVMSQIPQFSNLKGELPAGPNYPSSRQFQDLKDRESSRLVSEFDDALERSRTPGIPLDGPAPAKIVPPSSAMPVSNKMAEHASSAMQGIQIGKAGAAKAAAGPAGAAMAVGDSLSSASQGDPSALAAAFGGGVLAIGALGALKVGKGVVDFARSSAEDAERRLAGLSPEVAVAQAEAELRRMRSNLRSADEIGPQTAQFIRGRSELQAELQEVRDNLSGPLIGAAGRMAELAGVLTGAGKDLAESNPLLRAQSRLNEQAAKNQEELISLLRRLLGQPKDDEAGNMFLWFNAQPDLPLPDPFGGNEENALFVKHDMPGLLVNQ